MLPDGEVLKLGGKVAKNSTGYALKDLIVGSEGTLAVVAEAVLKLIPLPKESVSMLVPFASIRAAIETVPKLIASGAPLTAVEFMERETIVFSEDYLGKRFPDTKAPAYLLLTADGNTREEVDRALEGVAELCLKYGASDAYYVDTEERRSAVWTARGAFLEAIKASTDEMDECDVVVPRNRIADFVLFTHELAGRQNIRIPSFGHAGDGNLHIYVCRDGMEQAAWEKKLAAVFDELYEKARELGGLVSGEHGIGYAKKPYMRQAFAGKQIELMRGIKAAFDPNNILNPDKLF